MAEKLKFDTRAVHAGTDRSEHGGAAVTPIYRSTVFEFEGGLSYHDIKYPRLSTLPNQVLLGQALADLEDGEAGLATASGMAAISTALLSVIAPGDHLLAHKNLYGGTHSLITEDLAGWGVEFTLIDATNSAEWEAALRPNTRAVYVESLTNPLLEVADHRSVVEFARAHNLTTLIDSTFATPVLFRPLTLGYDLVLHSATKYMNGHSDVVAGAVVGSAERVAAVKHRLDHLGGSIDPQAAYLFHRGLRTLGLRVRRQNENALAVARALAGHPKVARVHYPGLEDSPDHARAREYFGGRFGAMLAVELAGGADAAARLCQSVRLFVHSPSLGGVESLITQPAQTSHAGMSREAREALGVTDGLLRVSIGIEDPGDLIADFDRALAEI